MLFNKKKRTEQNVNTKINKCHYKINVLTLSSETVIIKQFHNSSVVIIKVFQIQTMRIVNLFIHIAIYNLQNFITKNNYNNNILLL